VPDICPAPLPVSASTRALLQQCDLPGGGALIESLITLSDGGAGAQCEEGSDGAWAGASTDSVNEAECMLEQWLIAVLAATTSQVPAGLDELSPFFFRLAVILPT